MKKYKIYTWKIVEKESNEIIMKGNIRFKDIKKMKRYFNSCHNNKDYDLYITY